MLPTVLGSVRDVVMGGMLPRVCGSCVSLSRRFVGCSLPLPMSDPQVLVQLGLWGLFLAAFLAGSILPFASEAVLSGLLVLGASPGPAVAVATAGNVLGGLTVYAIGYFANRGLDLEHRFVRRFFPDDPGEMERARLRVERFGSPLMLLAWLPLVGEVLVLAAGLARLGLWQVAFYMTVGKALRYLVVAWVSMQVS